MGRTLGARFLTATEGSYRQVKEEAKIIPMVRLELEVSA